MKNGEEQTFLCGNCERKFTVSLEPEAADLTPAERGMGDGEVEICPFCDEDYPEPTTEARLCPRTKSSPTL